MNKFTIVSIARGAMLCAVIGGLIVSVNAAETPSKKGPNEASDVTVHRTVRYSDLDLTVQSDVVRLYRRIERAASAVCGGRIQPLVLQSPRFRECKAKALAEAVHGVGAPTLTAYYDSKRGTRDMAAKRYAEASPSDAS